MPVVEKQQTQQEKEANAKALESMESSLASSIGKTPFVQDIINSMDLPTGLANSIDNKIQEDKEIKSEEPAQENAQEVQPETSESPNNDTNSEETVEPDNESSDLEEEQDLIPKSKVQKRIDELTREKRLLESRLEKLEKAASEPKTAKDPDLEKLENMNERELKELKKRVLIEQARSINDESKLVELMELNEKIDGTLKSAPIRFQTQQVEKFNEAVQSTNIENFDTVKDTIFNYAKNIFMSAPELQSSITGQARAWDLAVEHYKELNKISSGKSKVNELERKVNTLKKKVSLETSVQKGNTRAVDEAKVFNKAKSGSESDRVAFFKSRLNTDNLIPDEYKR